ncbi:hypothetical protein niasHS_009182 [Heterodera schachtii]|uniref:Uncharacterized protein n=1 Tax=Heterodera schachtii TaxID=97005 RepID=A0ABD2JE36_HETSC
MNTAKGQSISTEPKEAKNDWTAMCKANITDEEFERLFPKHTDKYLFASWYLCGGLANQMWRFVSLYGIGKPYGRKPIYTEKQNCRKSPGRHPNEGAREMEELFPVFASQIKYIKKLNNTPISVVLMGKEKDFFKSLTINRTLFANVYLPKSMPRANDLAFATTACDSLLITAQFSSFSWWIAYLMPDNATIFYNSKITKNVYTTNENFLDEWVPIELVNGKITLSNGVHLTNGGGGFKEIRFCPLAQCHAANDGPNEIAKMPYGIEFRPTWGGNCEDGILICYRALLQRGNHLDTSKNSKFKRKFIVDAKMGNSIEKDCLKKMPKDGNKNGTIIWRAIKMRTMPMQTKNNNDKERSIILESSIASNKFKKRVMISQLGTTQLLMGQFG